MSAALFLLGGMRLSAPPCSRTEILELCRTLGCDYTDFDCTEDGSVVFSLPAAQGRRLLEAAGEQSLPLLVLRRFGAPVLLGALLWRPGLLLGLLLGVCLLFLSGRFLWAVEVTGNETVSDTEIEELLASCDFFVGRYLPSVSVRELENRVLIASDRISWIAINLRGTVAHVQVLERAVGDEEQESTAPAHLVAARDGQIEYFEEVRGVRTVRIGQAVRAGEMLVSGIYAGEEARYTRASGRVLARTERSLEILVPYAFEEKVYGKGFLSSLTLNFFNFSLKIFENSRNAGESCDIIETEKVFPTLGEHAPPVSLTLLEARPYEMRAATRSQDEAVSLAFAQLEREISATYAEATLLSRTVKTVIGEDGVRLVCTLSLIEDIATVSEFTPTE